MVSPAVIQRKKLHAVWEPPARVSPTRVFTNFARPAVYRGLGRRLKKVPLRMTLSPNSLKSYLFECRAVMNSATLRSEAGPLKNFAVFLSHETVRNFAARRGPPILADVVKAILQFMRCYHTDSMSRHFDPFSHICRPPFRRQQKSTASSFHYYHVLSIRSGGLGSNSF